MKGKYDKGGDRRRQEMRRKRVECRRIYDEGICLFVK